MFVHNESIVLPSLKQVNLTSGRVYRVTEGAWKDAVFPSITRVLAAKPKPHLDAWKQRIGHAEASRIRDRATARGQKLHTLAERHLSNLDLPDVPPSTLELWRVLRPWLDKHVTCVYKLEANVFSERLGVAGRFDGLVDLDDELTVLDFKQADKPKREEWIVDYYLQGTFYSLAVYELTGKKVKRIVFPIASPEGLQVFETKPLTHFKELRSRISSFYAEFASQIELDATQPSDDSHSAQSERSSQSQPQA